MREQGRYHCEKQKTRRQKGDNRKLPNIVYTTKVKVFDSAAATDPIFSKIGPYKNSKIERHLSVIFVKNISLIGSPGEIHKNK